jgi:MFS family permease
MSDDRKDLDIEKDSHVGSPGLPTVDYSNVDDAKLLRKIDLRVLPYMAMIIFLSFLDRVSVSNAVLYGLQQDLKLVGNQYNTILVIFFVPYIAFEIPSNYFLKKFSPHVWLSACMFGFGLFTIIQGFTHNFGGMVAARFFVGFFEAGMFPGCYYIIAMWYRRAESQKRFAYAFSAASLAAAFGGLLATAIGKMDGIRGYRGWRWIFILEGLGTCVIAIIWFFLLPDFPEQSKRFTPDEMIAIKQRLASDVGASGHQIKYTWRDYLGVFKDYKIFLSAIMYFGIVGTIYCYALFAPTIIKSFGYTVVQSQLRSVPPAMVGFVMTILVSYISDKIKHRTMFVLLPAIGCIAGFAILLANPASTNTKYGALFLAGLAPASLAVIVGWCNMNLAGHLRRQTGSAFQVMIGNFGGIIGSYAFPAKDAPRFSMGYWLCVALTLLSVVTTLAYAAGITLENRKRDKNNSTSTEDLTEEQLERAGDLNPSYRYIL